MADRSIDKREQYVEYATHCLKAAASHAKRFSNGKKPAWYGGSA
jgi:hypothetical protein